MCAECRAPLGPRNNSVIDLTYAPPADAGFMWCRNLFSDRFISLLTEEERSRLEFRNTIKPKRVKRDFYELVGTPMVNYASVKGFNNKGFTCVKCGERYFKVTNPILDIDYVNFICKDDLPDILPSCFTVGNGHEIELCMTRARWEEIRPKVKDVSSRRLGVVNSDQCDRDPEQFKRGLSCKTCQEWRHPMNNKRREQRCWTLAEDTENWQANPSLNWFIHASQAKKIEIVRQNASVKEIIQTLENGSKPKIPMMIFFRCPNCFRPGEIVLNKKEFTMDWWIST